mgnify:CR=1 FL=1
MKITKVDVLHLKTNLKNGHWRPIVCRIYTDEGIYGDGEAALAYGESQIAAFGIVQNFAKLIIGMDPLQHEVIWDKLYRTTFWGQNGGPVIFAGISAIDIALWDIKGKYYKAPVYQLLGGKCRDELRCYASQLQFGWTTKIGPWGSDKEYVDIVRHAVSEGYDAVKIDFTTYDENAKKIPHLSKEGFPDRSLYKRIESRMAAIREEFPDIDIIVENHCQTDLTSAIRIGELCDKYDMMAYEEPVTMLNPDMMKELRQRIRTPLAAGERIYSRWGYYNFLKNNSIQLIQPDACNCGGITELKKIADMAHVFDARVQVHVAGAVITNAASIQLEAAIPNFGIHEHHFRTTQECINKLGKYDMQPVNGKYIIPDRPGLGQELSDFAIETALMHTEVTDFIPALQ